MIQDKHLSRAYFTWDWLCILITLCVSIILLGVVLFVWVDIPSWVHWYLGIFLIPALVGVIAICPVYIERRGQSLFLRCLLYKHTFNLEQCRSITPMEGARLSGAIRSFGSGGFFGYTGYWWSKRHGHFVLYTCHRRQPTLELITTKGRKYIIACPHHLVSDYLEPGAI